MKLEDSKAVHLRKFRLRLARSSKALKARSQRTIIIVKMIAKMVVTNLLKAHCLRQPTLSVPSYSDLMKTRKKVRAVEFKTSLLPSPRMSHKLFKTRSTRSRKV